MAGRLLARAGQLTTRGRGAPLYRHACQSTLATTSSPASQPAAPLVGIVTARRPIGTFRGSLIGFLLGLTVSGGAGYYYLVEEYRQASGLVLAGVEEVQKSTEKLTNALTQVQHLEQRIDTLTGNSATKEDLKQLRFEVKKVYDGVQVEYLDLKAHVWGMERDVGALIQKSERIVR